MNKKITRLAILPLTMLMLVSCGSGTSTTSAATSTATTSATSATHYSEDVTFSTSSESSTVISYVLNIESTGTVVVQKVDLKDSTGTVIQSDAGATAKKFTGLTAETTYTLVAYYTIDGVAKTRTTMAKTQAAPVAYFRVYFSETATTSSTITGKVTVKNDDGTYKAVKLYLTLNDVQVGSESTDKTQFNFTGLNAATKYTVELEYDYGSGTTLKEMLYGEDFTTAA